MTAIERMQKARIGLVTQQPFFGMLALRLEFVEDPKAKTHWVNGTRLGFNPEWAEQQTMADLEVALMHQVMTCALGHPFRRGGRDARTWNEASDYVVNGELVSSGIKLPDGMKTRPEFSGSYVEAVYSSLQQKPQEGGEGGGGKDKQQGGPQSGAGGNQNQGSEHLPPSAPEAPSGASEQGQGGGDQDTPSGASGSDLDGMGGEVRDAEAPEAPGQAAGEAEIEAQASDWGTAVAQAAQASRAQGKLPGSVERAMKGMLQPRVDWREALQRFIRSRAKTDYSWSRPNRRFSPLYLPSMDSPTCGPLVVVIDVSGSVSQSVLDQFIAEVRDIAETLRPEEVIVMCADTHVRSIERFRPGDEITVKPTGGGGTAFDDPFRKVEEEDIRPEALVYLTDLIGSCFAPEPHYPVLWASTARERAPYGEVIRVR